MNRDDEMRHDEMREVEARTTPGHDPRVEELSREQARPAGVEHEQAERPMEPATASAGYDRGVGSGGALLEGYRSRLAEAQARFIDDPRAAVQEARSVIEEAVDRFMESLGQDVGSGDDTERMRVAMQRYRDLFERLAEDGR